MNKAKIIEEARKKDTFEEALDIAIKETIDDRDRIHNINLECARQGAKQKVFDKIDELKKYKGSYSIIDEEDYQRFKKECLKEA